MTGDEKKAREVAAALRNGPYTLHESYDGWFVRGPDGKFFVDAHGLDIAFHKLDAEKLVRLYNMDAAG